jgi:hypothetical protein
MERMPSTMKIASSFFMVQRFKGWILMSGFGCLTSLMNVRNCLAVEKPI